MTKFIFAIFLCSSIAQECVPLISPQHMFDTYSECTLYGYEYSHEILKDMDQKKLDTVRVYTRFSCRESELV